MPHSVIIVTRKLAAYGGHCSPFGDRGAQIVTFLVCWFILFLGQISFIALVNNELVYISVTDKQTFVTDKQTFVTDKQTFVTDKQTFVTDKQTFFLWWKIFFPGFFHPICLKIGLKHPPGHKLSIHTLAIKIRPKLWN